MRSQISIYLLAWSLLSSTLGEVPWVRKVVDQFSSEAALKRLKIVQCCGFDCIPCDLGLLIQCLIALT